MRCNLIFLCLLDAFYPNLILWVYDNTQCAMYSTGGESVRRFPSLSPAHYMQEYQRVICVYPDILIEAACVGAWQDMWPPTTHPALLWLNACKNGSGFPKNRILGWLPPLNWYCQMRWHPSRSVTWTQVGWGPGWGRPGSVLVLTSRPVSLPSISRPSNAAGSPQPQSEVSRKDKKDLQSRLKTAVSYKNSNRQKTKPFPISYN